MGEARVALVTGAANGIGRATAEAFVEAGYTVAGWDLATLEGESTIELERVDVSNAEAVRAGVEAVIERLGRIDVLINNAGILRDSLLVKVKGGELVKQMSEEAFDAVVAVNLKGVYLCTQAVAPHMIARGYGRIVSASSVVGLYGNFGQTNYVAAKSGVCLLYTSDAADE